MNLLFSNINALASNQSSNEATTRPNSSNVNENAVNTEQPQSQQQQQTEPSPRTNTLFIINFVRPFTKAAVEELLNQNGSLKLVEWGMDFIKSKCFAVVSI